MAGTVLLDRWSRPIEGRVSKSSATDEVSEADRVAEAAVVSIIRSAHPDDSVVAEEGTAMTGKSGRRWLIDPLDGTTNFLYGIPQWCVSIACVDDRGPLAAVVHDPIRAETFFAERGHGAWLASGRDPKAAPVTKPIAPSRLADPALALLTTGFSYDAAERREQARRESQLLDKVRDVRRLGAAALDLAWVACGRLDGYYETVGNEWDWAAGRLLVQEAGGRVTDVPGVRPGVPGILASGPNVHDQLLAMIRAIAAA